MNKIVELITEYEELNRVYEEIVKAKGVVSYPTLKQVVNFYDRHPDLDELAKERLALRMDARDSYDDMLHLLLDEVKKNVFMYEENEEMFRAINVKDIVREHLDNFCTLDIKIQLANTNQWGKKKLEAGNSLETLVYSYGVDSDEYEDAEQEYNKYDERYKYEKKILDNLYNKRNAEMKEAFSYKESLFEDVYNMVRTLLSRLEGWCSKVTPPKEKENSPTPPACDNTSQKEIDTNMIFFDKKTIDIVYHYFVEGNRLQGHEFKNISRTAFEDILNLRSSAEKLEIINGKRLRVYHIISRLKDYVRDGRNDEWLRAFLENLGIKYEVYNSKYQGAVKRPREGKMSMNKEDFKKRLRQAFK